MVAAPRGHPLVGAIAGFEPAVVVEVLFSEIQASAQYPGGLALRFARITRLREDKYSSEADTMQTLRQLYDQQFQYKGRLETPEGAETG